MFFVSCPMEFEEQDGLRKQLIQLIELSRRPHLSSEVKKCLALQMSMIQAKLDTLSGTGR